jgi:hypothetical protein
MNESNDCYIWLRVKLSPDMHKRLKTVAAQNGQTLQGLTCQIIGNSFEGKKVGAEVVQAALAGAGSKPKRPATTTGAEGLSANQPHTLANLSKSGAYSK